MKLRLALSGVLGLGLLLTAADAVWAQAKTKARPGQPATGANAADRKPAEGSPENTPPDHGQLPPALGVMLSESGDATNGVEVVDVHPGSPAGKAGLRAGDFIISVDGKKISSPHDLIQQIRQQRKIETNAKIGIRRGKEESVHEIALTAPSRPRRAGAAPGGADNRPNDNQPNDNRGWLGIVLEEDAPGAPPTDGVRISQVYPKGPADKAGLKVGDVITRVNTQKVGTVHDLLTVMGPLQAKATVDVVAMRNEAETPVKVVLGGRDDFADLTHEDQQQPDFLEPSGSAASHETALMERRMAEQHQRIETTLQQVLAEVQSLRQEVSALRGKTPAAAGKEAGAAPAK